MWFTHARQARQKLHWKSRQKLHQKLLVQTDRYASYHCGKTKYSQIVPTSVMLAAAANQSLIVLLMAISVIFSAATTAISSFLPSFLLSFFLSLFLFPTLIDKCAGSFNVERPDQRFNVPVHRRCGERRSPKVQPSTRPGIEPRTFRLAVRDLTKCANLAHCCDNNREFKRRVRLRRRERRKTKGLINEDNSLHMNAPQTDQLATIEYKIST